MNQRRGDRAGAFLSEKLPPGAGDTRVEAGIFRPDRPTDRHQETTHIQEGRAKPNPLTPPQPTNQTMGRFVAFFDSLFFCSFPC